MKKLVYIFMASIFFIQGQTLNIFAKSLKDNPIIELNEADEIKKLDENYITFLTGNEDINTLSDLKSKIYYIEKNGEKALSIYMGTNNPYQLFKGEAFNMSPNVTVDANPQSSDSFYKNSQLIQDIALAYSTYGTKFYKKDDIKIILQDVISSFYNTFSKYMDYNKGKSLFGNWWNWEIGVPTKMSNALILTKEIIKEKDTNLLEKYVKCFDNYLRNGKNGDINLNASQHTGTNLIDITTNRILQGILINDIDRIKKAIKDTETIFKTIDPYNLVNNNTDGVYEDGSFIQHHRVAYTGTYGMILLQKASSLLFILNGTSLQPTNQIKTIEKWIYETFLPIMHEGFTMEIVKGRAVSRSTSGYRDSVSVVEAMVLLSMYLKDDAKEKMQQQIKYLSQNKNLNLQSKDLTLAAIKPYIDIVNNKNIKPINHIEKGSYTFNAMDKNIQIGDSFTFALSRSSNRVAKYENMNGENLKSWFQGDGAFYLYLNDLNQNKHFGIDYITTIDPNKYPGTTTPNETRKSLFELYNKTYYPSWPSSSKKQSDYVYFPSGSNNFSGSVKLDNISLAGMQLGDDLSYISKDNLPEDFVVYKNAEANKSWFMTNEEIVFIGSNIYDTQNRNLTTTIANNMEDPNDIINIYGGSSENEIKFLDEGTYSDLKWLLYENETANVKIGYYFPQVKDITIDRSVVSKNQKDIRNVPNQKDNFITKAYTTITYAHNDTNENNKDSYAYVMLPNANISYIKNYIAQENIKVIENSKNVHIVEDVKNKIKGYTFFEKGESKDISANSPVSLIIKEENDLYKVAVSDPLFSQDNIEFTLNGNLTLNEENNLVDIENVNNKTKITINTKNSYGKNIEFYLKK